MGEYRFHSAISERGKFPASFSMDEIKNEPMFFNCEIRGAGQGHRAGCQESAPPYEQNN